MRKLGEILLSAAMAATAPAALAQNKPDTYVDADMKTRIFRVINQSDENGTTLIGGISDDTIGILCKWKISGSIDLDTNRASAELEHHSCSANETTPASWLGGRLLQDVKFSPSSYKTIPLGSSPSVVEVRTSNPDSDGITSTYERVWDFSTNKVCIRHYQAQFIDKKLNVYIDMENGCHSMPQGRHTERMRKELHPKWSHFKAK